MLLLRLRERRVEKLKSSTNYKSYYHLCTFRFRELLDKWDINHDRVFKVEHKDGTVLTAETTLGNFPPAPAPQVNNAEPEDAAKEEKPMTIRELLAATGASVIGVKNVRTGIGAKVSCIQSDYGPIRGYLGSDPKKYSSFRKEIYDANKPEWTWEWQYSSLT